MYKTPIFLTPLARDKYIILMQSKGVLSAAVELSGNIENCK